LGALAVAVTLKVEESLPPGTVIEEGTASAALLLERLTRVLSV
jgi:hypothetical protein